MLSFCARLMGSFMRSPTLAWWPRVRTAIGLWGCCAPQGYHLVFL
jgi:hypothetical protein